MSEYEKIGLTKNEVSKRIKENKINGNYTIKTKSIKKIVLGNLFSLFNIINFVLAFLLITVNSYKNMMFMGVVLWNLFIGIFQEIRAKRIVDRLSLISAPKCVAVRDGKQIEINQESIVIDELTVLKNGNQVCADSIVIEGVCEVNESLLTGESDLIEKKIGDTVLSGSFIVSGSIKAKVCNIGKDNYVNKIMGGAKYIKKPNSQILTSLRYIIRFVSVCLLPMAVLMYIKQINLPDISYQKAIVSTVASVIGMIPSGLMLLTSVVLAISVIKLSKRMTLVQELYCIETLARVDVLCLDKTGTITEGTMKVDDLILLEDTKSKDELINDIEEFVGALKDNNPTYDAIKNEFSTSETRAVKDVIRFSSEKKWSAVTFEKSHAYEAGTYILGASEFILPQANQEIINMINSYSKRGQRVLLFAFSQGVLDVKNKLLPDNVKPLALILISDVIREDARETLEYFDNQGVTLKIISGDNPITVSNIAYRAGLTDADNYVDATTLQTNEDIVNAASKYTVFGRVTPYQKLELVKALKTAGHTVAMTGDGVNDVLALKEADCSIAMQSGSDAARNVSQLVLLDSNFKSLPHVVGEGRRTINNIQKSATLYLVKTIYAFLAALIFLFVKFTYPFAPIQLTLIGAATIGIPSFILALEPNLNRVKGRFLTNVLRNAIPGGIIVVLGIMLSYALTKINGLNSIQLGTMSTYITAFVSFVTLINVCRPFNKLRDIMCGFLITSFIIASMFNKGMFDLCKLKLSIWGQLLILAVILLVIYIFLYLLINKILGMDSNEFNVALISCNNNRTVLVLDDIDKKDYRDVSLLMSGNKVLRPDYVGFIKEPIYGGMARIEMMLDIVSCKLIFSFAKYIKESRRITKGSITVEINSFDKPFEVRFNENGFMELDMLPPDEVFYKEIPKIGNLPIVRFGKMYSVIIEKDRYMKSMNITIRNYILQEFCPEVINIIVYDELTNEVDEDIYVKKLKAVRNSRSSGMGVMALTAFLYENNIKKDTYEFNCDKGKILIKTCIKDDELVALTTYADALICKKRKIRF